MTPLSHESRLQITQEVERQLGPISASLRKQGDLIGDIDAWRRGLWGNGTGNPGYLERARREDTVRYERLFAEVEGLRAERLRAEGREQLRGELSETQQRSDAGRTNQATRIHAWVVVAGTLLGGAIAGFTAIAHLGVLLAAMEKLAGSR